MNKKKHILVWIFLLYLPYAFVLLSQKNETMTIMNRKAAVAGKFYSGDKTSLTSDLKKMFANAKERKADAVAIIAPHAGYIYSGEVAASAVNQINPNKTYDHIFIIGPSHTAYFHGASVYNAGNYETPLGEVKVDVALCNQLIRKNKLFGFYPEAHRTEHDIEVQLPFLQYHMKTKFQIVPIIIGSADTKELKLIAETLRPYFNDRNLFVISSDFSHYPLYDDAEKIDDITAQAICSGNPDSLIDVIVKYKNAGVPNLLTNMCGYAAGLILMNLTDYRYQYNQIEYRNSGDSPYGDHNSVVGYWAISVTKRAEGIDFQLSDKEKIQLLELARKAIETKLATGKTLSPDISDFDANLNIQCGAFVTLHENSALRGCIGRFEPNISLWKVVIEMAEAAAFEDYRFVPLTIEELSKINVEISVLTPLKKVESIHQILLGRDGIYIKKGLRSGTFLPQVAVETGWSLDEFLGHCAEDKAGIGYDGWKTADLYTYRAIVFSEKDFGLEPVKK